MSKNTGNRGAGYTILETLIFLAVSALLFVTAMVFIGGRQGRTDFVASVRSLETQLRDLSNDVSTGLYSNLTTTGGRIGCTATGSSITFTTVSDDRQGSNRGCIFMGQALQLSPSGTARKQYSVIPLAGRQFINADFSQGVVTRYSQSSIRAIAPASGTPTGTPNAIQAVNTPGQMTFRCAMFTNTAGVTPAEQTPCVTSSVDFKATDIIAYVTSFQTAAESGDKGVAMIVPDTARELNTNSNWNAATVINRFSSTEPIVTNPRGGVFICLDSASSGQYAVITLGGESSVTSVTSVIREGRCS